VPLSKTTTSPGDTANVPVPNVAGVTEITEPVQ
jgi:hypothetical protein